LKLLQRRQRQSFDIEAPPSCIEVLLSANRPDSDSTIVRRKTTGRSQTKVQYQQTSQCSYPSLTLLTHHTGKAEQSETRSGRVVARASRLPRRPQGHLVLQNSWLGIRIPNLRRVSRSLPRLLSLHFLLCRKRSRIYAATTTVYYTETKT